jgi:hypothetical protein
VSGWYPDPTGRFEYRFQNDSGWTADVSTGGRRSVDPLTSYTPPAAQRGRSNGLAVAGMVCGIVAVVIAWVPFIAVLGVIAAIVGLSLSIPALSRSRQSGRRGFAITGIVTSVCGLLLGVVGIVLTVVVVRAIDRFDNPGPVDARIEQCVDDDLGNVVAEIVVENLSSRERSYTIEVDLGGTTNEWVEVDDVAAGESQSVTVRGASFVSEPTCRIVSIYGPVPFGLDPDTFDPDD